MSHFDATHGFLLRINASYGVKDRRAEYAALLGTAREAGYDLISLAEFHARVSRGGQPDRNWLVLRHDVDIRDAGGNEAFWAIERAVGARSSFYFRLSTAGAHTALIGHLLREDFEVGYHFEEGATLAKRRHLKQRTEVLRYQDEIRGMFRNNCAMFRRRWSPNLKSVASHGDWINRKLAFTNNELLSPELLDACGLLFEAYDGDLTRGADVYVSDVARPPERWTGGYGLADALRDARAPIYLLTHERNWHASRRANAVADVRRLVDGIRYRMPL